MNIDQKYIDYFEKCLNPVKPENSEIPFEILDYGEISSIFKISSVRISLLFPLLSIVFIVLVTT